MATTHKLMGSGQLVVAGTPGVIYTAPGSTKGLIKTVVLHNTNSSAEVVEIFFNGTTAATKLIKVSLAADETFEWAVGHMVLLEAAQVLRGQSTTVDKVNYFIFGAEEA